MEAGKTTVYIITVSLRISIFSVSVVVLYTTTTKKPVTFIISLRSQQGHQIAMDVQATIVWLLIRTQREEKRGVNGCMCCVTDGTDGTDGTGRWL